MKKIFFTAIATVSLFCSLTAQAQSGNGRVIFSAGYGFPNFLASTLNAFDKYENFSVSSAGPFFGKLEFMITDRVGIGVNVAYSTVSGNFTEDSITFEGQDLIYDSKITRTSLSVLGRLNVHFGNSEHFDPYAGIGIGYRNAHYTYTSENPNGNDYSFPGFNPVGLDMTVGMRFYLTKNIGFYTEVGLAKAPIQVGVNMRF